MAKKRKRSHWKPAEYREKYERATPSLTRRRGNILHQYAVMYLGRPVMCPVNTDPREGFKVVYPSPEAATAAGVELASETRSRPMKAYRCPRDHSHWHLATDLEQTAPQRRRA